jgi:hypothetical protein
LNESKRKRSDIFKYNVVEFCLYVLKKSSKDLCQDNHLLFGSIPGTNYSVSAGVNTSVAVALFTVVSGGGGSDVMPVPTLL